MFCVFWKELVVSCTEFAQLQTKKKKKMKDLEHFEEDYKFCKSIFGSAAFFPPDGQRVSGLH